jgi:ligand-binding sensor domain-containing protein
MLMAKQFYFLLLFFFSFASCNGQVNPNNKEQIAKSQSEILDSLVKAGVDPYFVESTDTISTFGPKCIVRDVLEDKKGNLWLAAWEGIIKYDGKVFTNYTLKEGLIHFHVLVLFEDSKSNLWFSNVRGGVYRFDGKSFQLFTTKDGLADNTTMAFAEDKSGNIWFGTENGLNRYDGKTFTTFTSKDGLSDNNINSLLQDKKGMLWIGTTKGINRYDGKTFTNFSDNEGLSFQRVASLFEDKAEKIWIGSSARQAGGKGLCCYDGKTLTELVIPNFVMYIRQDKKENLLIAYNDYPHNSHFTLFRYNGKLFSKIYEQTEPQNNPAIFGMIEDKNGNLWFGSAKGVCRYNGKTFNYFY